MARFPDVKAAIVDGTERPVLRPKDSQRQQEPDSGKKKVSGMTEGRLRTSTRLIKAQREGVDGAAAAGESSV